MKYAKYETERAEVDLRKVLSQGDKVLTMVHNVSRSGMSRVMSVKVIRGDSLLTLDWAVSRLLGLPVDKYGRLKVSGVGMDMGFWIVYEIGQRLFGDGYLLKQEWL